MKWGTRDSSRNSTCINAKKCPGNRQSIQPDESEEFQKIQFGNEATLAADATEILVSHMVIHLICVRTEFMNQKSPWFQVANREFATLPSFFQELPQRSNSAETDFSARKTKNMRISLVSVASDCCDPLGNKATFCAG